MNVHDTGIQGLSLIEPSTLTDERGFFVETYREDLYRDLLCINQPFVQDNHSSSSQGVLRGLHFQETHPQGKLVRCVTGSIFDVVVDIRKESSTFGKWFATELNDTNKHQLWIPPGLAHGFLTLSHKADFEYKCTDYYKPDDQHCLLWNDPKLGINWPTLNCDYQLSPKDHAGLPLDQI